MKNYSYTKKGPGRKHLQGCKSIKKTVNTSSLTDIKEKQLLRKKMVIDKLKQAVSFLKKDIINE